MNKSIKGLRIFLLLILSQVSFSQNQSKIYESKLMQGIWHAVEYIKEPFPNVDNQYVIIEGNKRVELDLVTKEVNIFTFGFQDISKNSLTTSDGFSKKKLRTEGLYYTEILAKDTLLKNQYFSVDNNFYCLNNRMFLFYTEYERDNDAIPKIIEILKNKSNKDKRDYLKEFRLTEFSSILQIKVISNQAFFYQYPRNDSKRKAYLIKGDNATIKEIKGDWVLVIYQSKKPIEGWLKKSDVEILK